MNYNVQYFVEQCLYAVIKATKNIKAEIIVVDNNSTDKSQAYLPTIFSSVQFIWNKENIGFGRANNLALTYATGDYILYLNPDTIVAEDSIEKCIQFFKKHEDCGALGVRMIDGSGVYLRESKRSFPSLSNSFYKIIGLSSLFPKSPKFSGYYAGHLSEHKNNIVDVLAGAFMMLDKKMTEDTKGFDEDFFMYGEDIDLSKRINLAGKKNYYFAETIILHFKGESTKKLTHNYIRQFYGAMKLYVKKHFVGNQFMLALTNLGIQATQWKAVLTMLLNKALPNKKKDSSPFITAIIATQNVFDELLDLIKYSTQPFVIVSRLDPTVLSSTEIINEVKQLQKQQFLKQIIFCGATISNVESLHIMQALGPKINYLFHQENSNSIVGSRYKDENGIIIFRP